MFGRLVSTKESKKSLAIGLTLVLAGGFLAGVSASNASDTPLNGSSVDIHTPQPSGGSWISVAEDQKLYAEDFNEGYDDDSFFSIPVGVECSEDGGPSKSGPMIVIGDGIDCTYASSTEVFRYTDEVERNGALEIGFEINFFGDRFDSLYPSENGAVFFSRPNTRYNKNILELSGDSESSGMYPLAMDLYFNKAESNFWSAKTTVDGIPAFVMSWENLDPCCTDQATPNESTSFQLVLLDLGEGDFDAYFNYASFVGMSSQGYDAPQFAIDLSTTAASDTSVRFDNLEGFPTEENCVAMEGEDNVGDLTDQAFEDAIEDDFYARLLDASTKSVSLFSDSDCLTPIEVQQTQSVDADRQAYYLVKLVSDFEATAIGWGTYSEADGSIQATELRKNIDNEKFLDGTELEPNTEALNRSMYRTTVPGRFVIGQRGGGTIGDPAGDTETKSTKPSPQGPTYGPTDPRPVYTNDGGLTVSTEGGTFLEYNQITTDDEHYLFGENWDFTAYSVVESGSSRLPMAKDGSLKLRTKGSVALRGSGYEPKAKISVFAMPSGTLLGTVKATKAGNMKLSNLRIPKGVSLKNTHVQVVGKSSTGEVRFVTLTVMFSDRNGLTGTYSAELTPSQKSSLRKMASQVRGEKIVTCVTVVPSSGEAESKESVAAKNACDYLGKQYPQLTTKVRQDSSSQVSEAKVRIVFSR